MFYSVIKDADPFLKFVLLTGVSKFSKVSLFSGLNNLRDITLSPEYSAICGYTDDDIDEIFSPELNGLDRNKIREWYNGYNWLGASVYNPFDVLLLLQEREFKPYWFESATPTFLIKELGQRQINTLELAALHSDQDLLGHFEIDAIGTEALLFQTGYLTIAAVDEPIPGIWEYTLSYPNVEVEVSLNKAPLPTLWF
ncbi:MAG: AAA family ATPase [Marinagarivorans sp.]|nr:AAA family ATPase [Marinagarivorans sp.]